jgi:hypothetical protein
MRTPLPRKVRVADLQNSGVLERYRMTQKRGIRKKKFSASDIIRSHEKPLSAPGINPQTQKMLNIHTMRGIFRRTILSDLKATDKIKRRSVKKRTSGCRDNLGVK